MRRHTFKENVISLLIGAVIGIGVGLIAVNAQRSGANVDEPIVSYLEPIKIAKTVVIDNIEEDPEPIKTDLGTYKITAYCPCVKCCGSWADGITKSGTVATQGRTIAVDPKVIPLGSVVEIDGVEYVAEDVGGAIKSNRVDIFFNSHEEALEYGVQYHEVFIVEEAIE